MADDIGWEAVTLKAELAHRAGSISTSLSGQPSLCDNADAAKYVPGETGLVLETRHHGSCAELGAGHAAPGLARDDAAEREDFRMGTLTAEMKKLIDEQKLGFVATVCDDGTPTRGRWRPLRRVRRSARDRRRPARSAALRTA